MKRIVGILIVLLVAAMGCNEQRMTVSALTAPDADGVGRVGIESDGTELFATAKYYVSQDIPWGPQPDIWGAGILFYPTLDLSFLDTPGPSLFGPLLETLHMQPYGGVEFNIPDDGTGRQVQNLWIAGSKFTLGEESDWALILEYQDGNQGVTSDDEHAVFVGARAAF